MKLLFSFFIGNARFLAFGLLMAIASSFGQTFFISLFSAEIRETYSLSHGEFGSLYSAMTLLSAAAILWSGRFIDTHDLRWVSSAVFAGLALACFLMAGGGNIVMLALSLFLLRQMGQGLMEHVSTASAIRYLSEHKGKALSIVNLGHPLGEAALPLITIGLIGWMGWRETWGVIGLTLVLMSVLSLWFLKGHGDRHEKYEADLEEKERLAEGDLTGKQWRRSEIIRDKSFYLIIVPVLAGAFIITGVFFNQIFLAEQEGWSLTVLASSYFGFAAAQVVTTVYIGPLVDRYGSLRFVPIYLVPLGVGALSILLFSGPLSIWLFMIMIGISTGIGMNSNRALWAELYGVRYLGEIKALSNALIVFSSALSPILFGLMIDAGAGSHGVALGCLIYILLAMPLALLAVKHCQSYVSSHAS